MIIRTVADLRAVLNLLPQDALIACLQDNGETDAIQGVYLAVDGAAVLDLNNAWRDQYDAARGGTWPATPRLLRRQDAE